MAASRNKIISPLFTSFSVSVAGCWLTIVVIVQDKPE
jgi:hypothetical protein